MNEFVEVEAENFCGDLKDLQEFEFVNFETLPIEVKREESELEKVMKQEVLPKAQEKSAFDLFDPKNDVINPGSRIIILTYDENSQIHSTQVIPARIR
jgi:hypothetical protein